MIYDKWYDMIYNKKYRQVMSNLENFGLLEIFKKIS